MKRLGIIVCRATLFYVIGRIIPTWAAIVLMGLMGVALFVIQVCCIIGIGKNRAQS